MFESPQCNQYINTMSQGMYVQYVHRAQAPKIINKIYYKTELLLF